MLPNFLLRVWSTILRLMQKGTRLNVFLHMGRLFSLFISAIKRSYGSNRDAVPLPEANLLPSKGKPVIGFSNTSLASDIASSRAEETTTSVTPVASFPTAMDSTVPKPLGVLEYFPTRLEEGVLDDASRCGSSTPNDVELKSRPQYEEPSDPQSRREITQPSSLLSPHPRAFLPLGSLIPILPTGTDRLRRDPRLRTPIIIEEIDPCTTTFNVDNVPKGWSSRIHPLGQSYYFKICQKKLYITEANIVDPVEHSTVQSFIDQTEQLILSGEYPLPEFIHIYLEPWHKGGSDCGYYMVDTSQETRCVFWLHSFDTRLLRFEQSLERTQLNLYHSMCSEYWKHCRSFPHCVNMTEDTLAELRGVLLHFLVDVVRYSESTIPFSRDDVVQLLGVMDEMKGLWLSSKTRSYAVCSIASIMIAIADRRIANHYGQPNCILYNSVSNSPSKRTLLIKAFSPPLFSAPDRYLRLLHNVNPNDFIYRRSWPQFIALLEKPWNDCILYATVLLAVNISYLAVPDIESAGGAMSGGQIASLCSTILSIGTIVVGLILVNEDHTEPKVGGYEIRAYFENLKSRLFGYEPLAILYSLPFALLMWSMLTFVVAIGLLSFDVNDVQRGIAAFPAVIVLCLIAWEVKVHWKP